MLLHFQTSQLLESLNAAVALTPDLPAIERTTCRPDLPAIERTTCLPDLPAIERTTCLPDLPAIDRTTCLPDLPAIDRTTCRKVTLKMNPVMLQKALANSPEPMFLWQAILAEAAIIGKRV